MEALASQVEELKAQLQSVKKHSTDQEEKVTELAQKLKNKDNKIESFHKQVKETDAGLQTARGERDALQQEVRNLTVRVAQETTMKAQNIATTNMLNFQLDKDKKQLAENADFLKALTFQAQVSYIIYEIVLRFQQEKNNTLKKKLEQEKRCNAERLKAVTDCLQQHMRKKIQNYRRRDSELEMSLLMMTKKLEDIRSQAKQLTSAYLTLTANINAEDKDSQDLRQETVELKVEVPEQKKEPVPDSQVLELQTEVAVQAEELLTTTTTTKRPTRWRRFCCFVGQKKKKKNREESDSDSN